TGCVRRCRGGARLCGSRPRGRRVAGTTAQGGRLPGGDRRRKGGRTSGGWRTHGDESGRGEQGGRPGDAFTRRVGQIVNRKRGEGKWLPRGRHWTGGRGMPFAAGSAVATCKHMC